MFPAFVHEEAFQEEDVYWHPEVREPLSEHILRTQRALDKVFDKYACGHRFISVTGHGGTKEALFHVVGHSDYFLETGGLSRFALPAMLPCI